MLNQYQGKHYGVFESANGYYVAAMASDGVSHYQPMNNGNGWSDSTLRRCNREAKALEAEAEAGDTDTDTEFDE